MTAAYSAKQSRSWTRHEPGAVVVVRLDAGVDLNRQLEGRAELLACGVATDLVVRQESFRRTRQ